MTALVTKEMIQIRSHWRAGMCFQDIAQATRTTENEVRNVLRQMGEFSERDDETIGSQRHAKKRIWLSVKPEEADMLLHLLRFRTGFPEADRSISGVYNRLMNGRSRYRKEHKLDA